MKYIIYKTTHVNGKYYIGRHGTRNLEDGYIGSGKWPRSILDKSTLTREILEYAIDEPALIELEGRYLRDHYGKPDCMNMSIDPVGFSSVNHPMKNPAIVLKISGENHWSHTNPANFQAKCAGTAHWMNKNPDAKYHFIKTNKGLDGSNSKLATSRGNNIFQTNNPSIWRSEAGIHHWQHGKSPNSNGVLNKKLIAAGTHNFLGPETNLKRVAAGTHNFTGAAPNLKMLANGTHPSQQKATCVHCGKLTSIGMHVRWHGDNCKLK